MVPVAIAVASALLASRLALAQDAPPPEGAPPPAGAPPAPATSDEDLEASVLGRGAANPPAPPPRTSPAARPPVAATPPAPRRAPHATAQDHPWPAAAPAAPGGADEADARPWLAIELGTSGLASGTLQGGLFAGARWANGLIAGGSLDYASSSQSVSQPNGPSIQSGTSTFRISAGVRYPVMRSEDGRVELYLAAGLGLERLSLEIPVDANSAQNVTAIGPTASLGPGLRLWVHERIAIGYVAQFRVTHLSGDSRVLPDFASPISPGVAGDLPSATTTDVTLEGAFQLLGIF